MDDEGIFSSSGSVPLLSSYSSQKSRKDEEDKQDSLHCQYQAWRPSLSQAVEEIKQLYSIAFPMIITGLLIYGKSAISMFFMGKLGKQVLAGGSLSIGIANISGYSVISGLAMGMEAISSQACGAKKWPLMTKTLQRTIAILLFCCLPISFLWLNIEPLLIFFGQDPSISSIASTYLAFSLPDLILQSFINPLKIYLRSQNITLPLMLSSGFALILHFPINYILVYHLNFDIQGIAMAITITDLNLLVALLLYLFFSGICRESWQGWSLRCFDDWKPILGLAIPNCISVCLEWWWYELMILLSGLLSNASDAVATMGILIQATSLLYIFPSALNLAVSTRVGNELGANQPNKAKTCSVVALSCAIFMSFFALLFMTSMRHAWGHIFTNDKAILSLISSVMPVVGLCELGNCPQTAGCGVLRGSARPTLGANINLTSFYGIGLPIAILMGFMMGMGLFGLWLGLLAAQVVCAIVMVVVLMRTDWEMEANRAKELTRIDWASEEAEEKFKQTKSIQGLISVTLVD